MFTGIIFAKYDTLNKIKSDLIFLKAPIRIATAMYVLVSWIYLRTFDEFAFYDFLITPFFIAVTVCAVSALPVFHKGIAFLGKHSENMWLIHSFYCYRFSTVVRFVFASRNALISLFVLIILSLMTAIALDLFYSFLGKLVYKYNKSLIVRS